MATYTETINLDGDFAENAKANEKALDSFESRLVSIGEGVANFGAMAAKAFVGAAAAIGTLVVAGAALALSAADAKGDMILLFDTLGEGALTGQEAVAMFDKLGEATGKTREELGATAQAFATMGVTGVDQLEKLTLAATSASAMAKGGGDAFAAMYKKISASQATGQALKIPLKGLGSLASMGLKVDDVAKQMGVSSAQLGDQLAKGTVDAKRFGDALSTALVEKGAGPVADAALDLGNMWKKAKESVGKFFEDIDTGPFLTEVKRLFGILDSGSESGKALKAGVGAFFKEVFALATKAIPVVRTFLLDMVIYGLKAYLALRPIVQAIKDFAASKEGVAVINGLGMMLRFTAVAAGVVVVALAAVAAVLYGIIAAFAAVGVAIVAFVAIATNTLGEWVASAYDMASNFVAGLVEGIASGGQMVADAVSALADQAKAAFTGALGIESPSKVMMAYGVHMGDGVAMGLDASAETVATSSGDMAAVAVEATESAPTASPGVSASGGGIVVNVEPGAIVIQGGSGESLETLTEQAVALLFERVAQSQGLA